MNPTLTDLLPEASTAPDKDGEGVGSAATCSPFDLEAVYDEEIAPLMTKIIEICERHKMPMLATFLYQHQHGEEELESYCTTSLSGEGDWKPEKIIKATEIIRRNDSLVAAVTITQR